MKDDIDGAMSGMLGRREKNYTIEEIEAAQKRKKKEGGTLLENLEAVTGRSLPKSIEGLGSSLAGMFPSLLGGQTSGRKNQASKTQGNASKKTGKAGEAAGNAVGSQPGSMGLPDMDTLISQSEELTRQLDEFTRSIEADYGSTAGPAFAYAGEQAAAGMPAAQAGQSVSEEREEREKLTPAQMLQKFNGLDAELEEKVFGQSEFIRKMVIAFKRPFVMSGKKTSVKNSIFITGAEHTGRHSTLQAAAKALEERGILGCGTVRIMDLSLYPTAAEEKLFLQDLYSALKSGAEIIAFENYESCHTSFLAQLSDLFMDGECRLSSRYIMQNGQLVNAGNSLASEAVGSLSAAGKYLVLISTRPVNKLADCFGAPFVSSIGDVCATEQVGADALEKIARREYRNLKAAAKAQLGFILKDGTDTKEPEADSPADETEGNGLISTALLKAGRIKPVKNVIEFFGDIYRALAEKRLNFELDAETEVVMNAEDGNVTADFGSGSEDLLKLLPSDYNGETDAIRRELDEIVGLKEIKEYILSLEEYYLVQQRRREQGLKAGEVSKHMIFTGSPGTGKTTIARIVSKYLKAIGVLTGGQLVEVSRADLVGRYVGHTAPLTNQVIASAIGGVLFIDEAYSLYRGRDDSFGLEAIDTLVKGIEDNRDNLIVILAGYSNEMEEFLTSNSGLKSRFPNIINFPDYTGEELLAIAKINAKSRGYRIDEEADTTLLTYFNAVQTVRAADAGNGRLARNKIEEAILNQSRRLVAEKDADLSLLMLSDFELDDIGG